MFLTTYGAGKWQCHRSKYRIWREQLIEFKGRVTHKDRNCNSSETSGIMYNNNVMYQIETFALNYRAINAAIVHSLSSGKVEIFLCAACHAFTPHVNAWKR